MDANRLYLQGSKVMKHLETKVKGSLQYWLIIATAVALQSLAPTVSAQSGVETRPALRQGIAERMSVPLFKSGVLRLDEPAARISVGNSQIADILILRSTQLYVLGKSLGSTNVMLWDRSDQLIGTVEVEVTHDMESLKAKLHELLPNDEITVHSAQRNIVLSGQVSNVASMEAAVRIAEGYLSESNVAKEQKADPSPDQKVSGSKAFDDGGSSATDPKVINLVQIGGGQQVMLEVKVAEIARSELRRIESKMAFLSESSSWSFGGVSGKDSLPGLFTPGSTDAPGILPGIANSINDKGLFAQYLSDDFLFSLALNAAKEEGLAKILAEPTLTTLTGQEAEFLSGGEFPIPVPQDFGTTTIEFKDFGVGLRFLPVVLGDGVINLKVNISVSELDDTNSLIIRGETEGGIASSAFFVPSLRKRSAEATYELRDGQTIGVAGLINENLREVINKFPGLGDLPVLGALFRSQSFIKGETELMILVTPRLAKPVDPAMLTLPTDAFVEPSDADFYLLGRMEGSKPAASNTGGGADSEFGHQVQ
jgi:pilus assembly protein CpaC